MKNQYFSYYSDCQQQCINRNISCLISEPERNIFDKVCIENYNVCKMDASSIKVCLNQIHEPIGGEAIWDDYQNQYHPTTTTEKPSPSPQPGGDTCHKWKILAYASTAVSTVTLSILIISRYLQNKSSSRSSNERLLNEEEANTTESI